MFGIVGRQLLATLGVLALTSVTVTAQQMTVNMYTVADGLGHNIVSRIFSDREGVLWFCTADGLSRFDGKQFVSFDSRHGAPFVDAIDILEAPSGDYWIATRNNGIVRLKDTAPLEPLGGSSEKRFQPYRVGATEESNDLLALHLSKSGVVWIGTFDGLFTLREQAGTVDIQPIPLALPGVSQQKLRVFGFAEDPSGSVYAAISFGIVQLLPGGGHVWYPYPPGFQADDLGSMVFHDGVLWLGQGSGLFLLRPAKAPASNREQSTSTALIRAPVIYYPNRFTVPSVPDTALSVQLDRDAGNNHVFAVHRLNDGRIWLATFGGMFEFSGGQLHRILPDVPFDYALKLGEDAAGNMWLGTNGLGVARVSFMTYRSFSRSEGLGKSFGQILIDRDGRAILPVWPRELAVLSEERVRTFGVNLSENVSYSGIQDIFQDHAREWWIATTAGLYHFPGLRRPEDLMYTPPLQLFRKGEEQTGDDYSRIFEDRDGDVWVGFDSPSRTAIERWERRTGRLYRYSVEEGLPRSAGMLVDICQDAEKSLWFAFSDGGLVRWKDNRFQTFGEREGLPGKHIASMTADIHGRVWLVMAGLGLTRLEGERNGMLSFKTYALSEEALQGRHSGTRMVADSKGRIYVGLMHSIDRLDPATDVMTHYGSVDGVPLGPIWSIAENPKDGGIWITSKTQVSRIRPDEIPESPPSPVLISGLRVSGVEYRVPVKGARTLDLRDLPYEKNSLQIDFMDLAFASRRSPVFQYRLEGSSRAWSEATSVRTVNYASLSPGDYTFEIREVPRGCQTDITPARLSFRILPPFWRRSWFVGSVALLLMSALVGFERYRATKLKQVRMALSQLKIANEALDIEAAISRVLAQSSDESAFPRVLETLCQRAGWVTAAFWESDRDTAVLRRAAQWPDAATAEAPTVLAPGQGLVGEVIEFGLQFRSGSDGSAAFPIRAGDATLGAIELHASGPREHEGGAATLAMIGGMLGQWIERLRAERALRVSEARFRTLAATAPDAIITIDEHGVIVFTNPSVSAVFGYTAEQMLGQELTMLMPPSLRQAHRQGFAQYLSSGERRISWSAVELPGLHCDGREMSLELSFGEFRREQERFFTAVIRDVTERKRTEDALRRSREERLAEIERVRRRIATDLHDDIGSSLTQISVLSEVARREVQGSASLERPLETIARSSQELIDSMSDIVWAINPQRDHLRDLVHRMRRFAADTLTARNIEFSLILPDSDGDIKLEGNLRREIFLIFKEALNNAVRHSGCAHADIEMTLRQESLLLRVADDGKGFDTTGMSEGHGLVSMSGRAEGIGGSFKVVSAAGQGCVMVLEVPLSSPTSVEST